MDIGIKSDAIVVNSSMTISAVGVGSIIETSIVVEGITELNTLLVGKKDSVISIDTTVVRTLAMSSDEVGKLVSLTGSLKGVKRGTAVLVGVCVSSREPIMKVVNGSMIENTTEVVSIDESAPVDDGTNEEEGVGVMAKDVSGLVVSTG